MTGLGCDRCGRGAQLAERFMQVSRAGILCEHCNAELWAFRHVAVDLMIEFGGHVETVTVRRLPATIFRYDKETGKWDEVRAS